MRLRFEDAVLLALKVSQECRQIVEVAKSKKCILLLWSLQKEYSFADILISAP